MPYGIADLTLDELIRILLAGKTLLISDGAEFSLPLKDSRSILAFYDQNRRVYWNPDKDASILEGEIDRVLDALDNPPKITPSAPLATSTIQKWRLTRIEAHRFRGLHRHCGDAGADPKLFELDLSADVTLFRGFNGAGKTSLVSAICWCLTGFGHRSQGLPSPLHEPILVQVANKDSSHDKDSGAFDLPAIVPIPTDQELDAIGGAPRIDTWVRLTFQSLIDGGQVHVERRLEREGKKNFKAIADGLDRLGLSDLALQVGTLMPGIAAATRFDDKTTLSQAVSTLTGLRPLAHFGKRSVRLHKHLTDKYPKLAKQEKEACEVTAGNQLQTLHDLLKDGEGLPKLDCVVVPTDATPEGWKVGLDSAENLLKAAENKAAEEALLILGTLPNLSSEQEIKRFSDAIRTAENCFSNAALKGLPSMRLASRLGELTEDDLKSTEGVLAMVETEAVSLLEGLSDVARADRQRLYGLVAKWHDSAHPGLPFSFCPVCERDLTASGSIPRDALLNQTVAEALENARTTDATLLKTAAEWERDTKQALRDRLPESLQAFVDQNVPDDLSTVYSKALSKEVFEISDFPDMLKPMSAGIAELCSAAWKEAPQREPLPGVGLPVEIPDNEGLRQAIKNVRRAIQLARYRTLNAEFARSAMLAVKHSGTTEDGVVANRRTIDGQFGVIRTYLQAATVFAGIRRQLKQISDTCEKWAKARTRISKLERAAKAVEPFKEFPDLVHDQVTGLVSGLQQQASHWSQLMYKAHFVQAPEYAGLDPTKSDGFTFLAAHGKHLVEAHHVMNASALRAYLSAFVLALWQQVWARFGGISTVLMDDPQDLLDPGNVANLAATVPHLIAAGMKPLIVSNDFGFIPAIEGFVSAPTSVARSAKTAIWEFSAISTSKSTVSLAPVADEVRARCDQWQKTDANDVVLARNFVHPVRVRIEIKLWDLLASDPVQLRDPTLGDLLGKIAIARNNGEPPFNEEPFRLLLGVPALQTGAPFRNAINKAHHGRADQITPAEAEIVRQDFEDVFSAIDACWLSYARFMRRLPPAEAVAEARKAASDLRLVLLPTKPIVVIGSLAARAVGAPLMNIEDASDNFELASLGEVALYTLRAATLGLVAFPGQTLIVSATAEVKNGDLAIVRTPGKTYARRVGIDKADLSRIVLETMPSTGPRVPPTHFIQRSSAELNKVVGVLFDETPQTKSQDEAVQVEQSAILDQIIAAAVVVGDSAFPVAQNGGHALLGKAPDLSLLRGRILAVVTRTDPFSSDFFAYLKRLGKQMPNSPTVHYLENVGQSGDGEFVQFQSTDHPAIEGIPIVQQTWKVLGTILP